MDDCHILYFEQARFDYVIFIKKKQANIFMILKGIIVIALSYQCSMQDTVLDDCHYTCETCFGTEYYQCLSCPQNRGEPSSQQPISGMCYCTQESDESLSGQCLLNNQFNFNNKAAIASLIGLTLLLSLVTTIIAGMRYFLLKTIEDVQQISILVFINVYFPQQLDIFLTKLYRFNMSSFTFESMTNGGLFNINSDNQLIASTDGQNIYGKYKLLYKTANFFANQFTWIIVCFCLIIAGIIIYFIRQRLRVCQEQNINEQNSQNMVLEESQANEQVDNQIQCEPNENDLQQRSSFSQNGECPNQSPQSYKKKGKLYWFFNKICNMTWLNFYITFFYLSITEINLNIFTQITNLTFSSTFAAVGAYFSAVFMALQFVLLYLLALKIREECYKAEWFRDHTFTAPIYLIRTNYKMLTRYFWFISCIKKIIISLFLTIMYSEPKNSILAISAVQFAYICCAIYLQPLQRRYLRIHFYVIQALKLFLYLGMLNFTEKYIQYIRMIQLTQILYNYLVGVFAFSFCYCVINIIVERQVYYRYLRKIFCASDRTNEYIRGRIGYHSQGKLYLYQRQ